MPKPQTVQEHLDAYTTANKDTPGVIMSGLTGAYAGATMGIAPFVSDQYREDAWKAHPGAYGTGYVGGTAASMIGAPEALLAKGAGKLVSRLAPEATTMAGAGMEGTPTAVQAGQQVLKNMVPESVSNIASKFPSWMTGKPAQATGKATGAVIENITNTPKPVPAQAGELGSATPENSAFPELQKYLAQATDQDAKRKIAMELASTEGGRAVSNADSPLNEDNQST